MQTQNPPNIALLTAGRDKSYALGLAAALVHKGIALEFLGSDAVDGPELHNNPLVVFRNMRGDQAENAPLFKKVIRILKYYGRLIGYAASAQPRIFHILWNNKFEWFDRTILLLFYKACGRRIVYTAHNVNIGDRDGTDSVLNRLTLRVQYKVVDDIFVHTELMRRDLEKRFHIRKDKIHVIPFPVNSTVPDTVLDRSGARSRLGLSADDRVLLAYGAVAPYKGLEYLVDALKSLSDDGARYRLLIAGRLKEGAREYWEELQRRVWRLNLASVVLPRIEFIPDEETEIYFKAADVLVLPYTFIFQSGVLFLGYNYGLPALAADVGSFRADIVEGKTGFIFRPKDSLDLARTIQHYFKSELYKELPRHRQGIREFAFQNYSWSCAIRSIVQVYSRLSEGAL